MLSDFQNSRRAGLSHHTILFYQRCLGKAIGIELTAKGINDFLASLNCGNGKFAYYRAIRAFCNWPVRNDYLKDNPLKKVDPPKPIKPILPSLTNEQVNYWGSLLPKMVLVIIFGIWNQEVFRICFLNLPRKQDYLVIHTALEEDPPVTYIVKDYLL